MMIDTVVLTLQADQFRVSRPEKFKPNAKTILGIGNNLNRTESHLKAVCNPTKADTSQGLYMPRMTLNARIDSAGRYNVTLRVECSLPKLIYGNNFDELINADLERVLDTLSDRMAAQGVVAAFHDLKYAEVSSVHYSKNILLAEGMACSSVLHTLAKVNVNGWLDVAKTDYRNGGHLYKIHSNDFELAFYDKVKDLEKAKKSPKRAYEDDVTIQQNLLRQSDFDRKKQVLRIEARLGSRRKIREVMERLRIKAITGTTLKFEALFCENVSKQVLLNYWKPYKANLPIITASAGKTAADLYQQVQLTKPQAKDNQILKLVAAYTIIDEIGWVGFKSLWKSTDRSLARLRKDVQELKLASSVAVLGFEQIERALCQFQPLRLTMLEAKGKS